MLVARAFAIGLAFFTLYPSSVVAAPPAASASPANACTQSYEQGQRQRKKGALLEAKRELSRCTSDACPTALASDCLKWLGEVESALPSIVVAIVDPDGRDIVEAHATIDDAQEGNPALGRAFDVDPGTHRVRASAPNLPSAEETIIVREGEKRRPIRIVLGTPSKPREAPPPAPRSRGVLPYALLGLGGLSLGAAAGFGIHGLSQKSILDACRPECEADRVDALVDSTNRAFLVSDLFLAVGIVATGLGAYLFVTQPSAQPAQAGLR